MNTKHTVNVSLIGLALIAALTACSTDHSTPHPTLTPATSTTGPGVIKAPAPTPAPASTATQVTHNTAADVAAAFEAASLGSENLWIKPAASNTQARFWATYTSKNNVSVSLPKPAYVLNTIDGYTAGQLHTTLQNLSSNIDKGHNAETLWRYVSYAGALTHKTVTSVNTSTNNIAPICTGGLATVTCNNTATVIVTYNDNTSDTITRKFTLTLQKTVNEPLPYRVTNMTLATPTLANGHNILPDTQINGANAYLN